MQKPTVLVYSPQYQTDLRAYGISTPFALDRGQRVLDALTEDLGSTPSYAVPQPLSFRQLRLVHTHAYLKSLKKPETWQEIMGLRNQPRSQKLQATKPLPLLLNDFRLKSGGTLLAAQLALAHGGAANLGAGYHHAHAARGEGFCAINDVAIAIRSLQKRRLCQKALIVDVDFHQGNGNATIFNGDETVFTLSIHAAGAWPYEKAKSSLDIPIRHNESALYLERLQNGLQQTFARFQPDICFFVEGSDAYEKDFVTGSHQMKLTLEQMQERDQLVIDACLQRNVPIVLVFAGGYSPDCWRVHYHAVRHLLLRLGLLKEKSTQ